MGTNGHPLASEVLRGFEIILEPRFDDYHQRIKRRLRVATMACVGCFLLVGIAQGAVFFTLLYLLSSLSMSCALSKARKRHAILPGQCHNEGVVGAFREYRRFLMLRLLSRSVMGWLLFILICRVVFSLEI